MISPPPTRPKQQQKAPIHDVREFEVPDGLSYADSLRYIADQVEAEDG